MNTYDIYGPSMLGTQACGLFFISVARYMTFGVNRVKISYFVWVTVVKFDALLIRVKDLVVTNFISQ